MATNTFKRVTKANISSASGSPTTLYTVPSGKTSIIIGCLITNKTTSPATINVQIDTSITAQDDVFITSGLNVPPNSGIEIAMGKVVLTHDSSNGDIVKAYGSASTTFDITLSVLEDVNT